MPNFTFGDLCKRYGEIIAWHYLELIERSAGLSPQRHNVDPESRLIYAFNLQDQQACVAA